MKESRILPIYEMPHMKIFSQKYEKFFPLLLKYLKNIYFESIDGITEGRQMFQVFSFQKLISNFH